MTGKKEEISGKTRIMEHDDFIRESDTQKLKSLIPGKTDAEYGKINRKFLRDAEPFSLGRLIDEVKKIPEDLQTGYRILDSHFHIPGSALTLVAGPPESGKSLFLMNLMLNLAQQHRGKHFLFYTYVEGKADVEIKLINMLGERAFSIPDSSLPEPADSKGRALSNLKSWKRKLKTMHEAELLKLAGENLEYRGLQKFLDLADRIHIIDQHYNLPQLLESMKLFSGPFRIGGMFLDFLQKIRLDAGAEILEREEQLQEVSGKLRHFSNEMHFPLILSFPISSGTAARESGTPGSDSRNNLHGMEHDAGLVIGVQLDNQKPGRMLIRVLADRNGSQGESELNFDRQLLRITDPA